MTTLLSFTKMQGIGNDFVVIDDFFARATAGTIPPELARRICDRRFGIGADQILWLKPAQQAAADVRMEILNADGSSAEMCGNGIRAVALYVDERIRTKKPSYRIETLAGIKTVSIAGDQVSVEMGVPGLGGGFPKDGELLEIGDVKLRFFEVNMGNPHAVFFVDDLDAPAPGQTVESLGPRIETHARFPKRTNVEFVKVEGPSRIRVRVWERGAGITLACGTGACASAVATLATGRAAESAPESAAKDPLTVSLPGGDLRISWDGAGHPVVMEGPACEVFRGEFLV